MRKAFIQSLIKLASTDERVVLLTGDLGYLVIEEFIERFPKQFYWPMSEAEYEQALQEVSK